MSCYTTHRRKRAKRYGSFSLRVEPENDVSRVSAHVHELRSNRRHGVDNEHRLFEVFASGDMPEWFASIRPATLEEDNAGVDAWVSTTDGSVTVTVPVQVKSSDARAAQFRARHPYYEGVVVVIHPAMPDEQIRETVLKDVERVLFKKGKAA